MSGAKMLQLMVTFIIYNSVYSRLSLSIIKAGPFRANYCGTTDWCYNNFVIELFYQLLQISKKETTGKITKEAGVECKPKLKSL